MQEPTTLLATCSLALTSAAFECDSPNDLHKPSLGLLVVVHVFAPWRIAGHFCTGALPEFDNVHAPLHRAKVLIPWHNGQIPSTKMKAHEHLLDPWSKYVQMVFGQSLAIRYSLTLCLCFDIFYTFF